MCLFRVSQERRSQEEICKQFVDYQSSWNVDDRKVFRIWITWKFLLRVVLVGGMIDGDEKSTQKDSRPFFLYSHFFNYEKSFSRTNLHEMPTLLKMLTKKKIPRDFLSHSLSQLCKQKIMSRRDGIRRWMNEWTNEPSLFSETKEKIFCIQIPCFLYASMSEKMEKLKSGKNANELKEEEVWENGRKLQWMEYAFFWNGNGFQPTSAPSALSTTWEI